MARTKKPQPFRPGTLSLRRMFTKSNTRAAAKKTDHSFSNKHRDSTGHNLPTHTPPSTMPCSNQQQNKLKLLVIHVHSNFHSFSILSTEEEEDENSTIKSTKLNPYFFESPVASCHELVLTVKNKLFKDEELVLWNPSTNDFETLPRSPQRPSVEYDLHVGFYGLGLDPKTTNDYKVIRFVNFEYDDDEEDCVFFGENQVELYSLKTNSWKRIPYPHADDIFPYRHHSIYINGFTYWRACIGTKGEDLVIFSFDFSSESFPSALIPGPNETYKIDRKGRHSFLLAEFEGSLALVVYDKHEKQLELWVWNKEVVSWSRNQVWTIDDVFKPLAFLKNHLFYFQDSKGKLVLFDCAKQKSRKILGIESGRCVNLNMLPFVGRGF